MKLILHIIVALAATNAFAKNSTLTLDSANSKVNWEGAKKIGDKHTGEVKVKSGSLIMNGTVLVGGEFKIDMSTITNADVESKEWNKKLVDHLKSPDFFDVKKHPLANFKIKKVMPFKNKGKVEANVFTITGDMKIRGMTNTESFQATITPAGKTFKAKGNISFDRMKYKVSYNSESNILKKAIKIAKDKIIKDTVNVSFDLTTKAI